jgi:hypothetical protein
LLSKLEKLNKEKIPLMIIPAKAVPKKISLDKKEVDNQNKKIKKLKD